LTGGLTYLYGAQENGKGAPVRPKYGSAQDMQNVRTSLHS
jgi:hypothetical protein